MGPDGCRPRLPDRHRWRGFNCRQRRTPARRSKAGSFTAWAPWESGVQEVSSGAVTSLLRILRRWWRRRRGRIF
jgi:hypothetical protein